MAGCQAGHVGEQATGAALDATTSTQFELDAYEDPQDRCTTEPTEHCD